MMKPCKDCGNCYLWFEDRHEPGWGNCENDQAIFTKTMSEMDCCKEHVNNLDATLKVLADIRSRARRVEVFTMLEIRNARLGEQIMKGERPNDHGER